MLHQEVDVIFIGAGLSGITMARGFSRLQPNKKFLVLEGRSTYGGTWDFFKYPGLRPDTTVTTLGMSDKPIRNNRVMTSGPEMMEYLGECILESHLEDKIVYNMKVTAADYKTEEKLWYFRCESGDVYRSRFLVNCCGYYSYDNPHNPKLSNEEDFKGPIVHAQFWDTNLDFKNKTVAIVGSGATAATLAPSLILQGAKHVHLLQRSPSYYQWRDRVDTYMGWARAISPRLWWWLIRVKDIVAPVAQFLMCRLFPHFMQRRTINAYMSRFQKTPKETLLPHFKPSYLPWEQRLLYDADGELLRCVDDGSITMHTGTIQKFQGNSMTFKPAHPAEEYKKQFDAMPVEKIEADILVKATGLTLAPLSFLPMTIDGKKVDITQSYTYKGLMLTGIPNMMHVMGYLINSWTLKVELEAVWLSRLVSLMDSKKAKEVVAIPPANMPLSDLAGFNSGYIIRAEKHLPKLGAIWPFQAYHLWFQDWWAYKIAPIDCKYFQFRK